MKKTKITSAIKPRKIKGKPMFAKPRFNMAVESMKEIRKDLVNKYRENMIKPTKTIMINKHRFIEAQLNTICKHLNNCYNFNAHCNKLTGSIFSMLNPIEATKLNKARERLNEAYFIWYEIVCGTLMDRLKTPRSEFEGLFEVFERAFPKDENNKKSK